MYVRSASTYIHSLLEGKTKFTIICRLGVYFMNRIISSKVKYPRKIFKDYKKNPLGMVEQITRNHYYHKKKRQKNCRECQNSLLIENGGYDMPCPNCGFCSLIFITNDNDYALEHGTVIYCASCSIHFGVTTEW